MLLTIVLIIVGLALLPLALRVAIGAAVALWPLIACTALIGGLAMLALIVSGPTTQTGAAYTSANHQLPAGVRSIVEIR